MTWDLFGPNASPCRKKGEGMEQQEREMNDNKGIVQLFENDGAKNAILVARTYTLHLYTYALWPLHLILELSH